MNSFLSKLEEDLIGILYLEEVKCSSFVNIVICWQNNLTSILSAGLQILHPLFCFVQCEIDIKIKFTSQFQS